MLNYFGPIGLQYNPAAIGQWGLGAWSNMNMNNGASEREFVLAVEWMRQNISVDARGHGTWYYHFDADGYGRSGSAAPLKWSSGLAQSLGVSLLLRSWKKYGESRDLELAEAALRTMITPIAEGGLLRSQGDIVVIEESVTERLQAVLDGIIFAIFGLQDFCFAMPQIPNVAEVTQRAVQSIRRMLPHYDLGYWSRADLYSIAPPMPASRFYHSLHIEQLKALHDLYRYDEFEMYGQKWDEQRRSIMNRSLALARKVKFKALYY